MSESKLTAEQIEYLSNEVEEKFGHELKVLKARLDTDMKHWGVVSKETVIQRDNLMAKILKEKHKNYKGTK